MNKIAVVTGCNGQDGALLSQLLLDKGYKVIGVQRRTSSKTDWRLHELGLYDNPNFRVCSGDLTDQGSLDAIVKKYKPEEFYNLAAQSFVGASWDMPIATMDVTAMGAVRVLEAVRHHSPKTKVYQASSSEMFGICNMGVMLDEDSRFHPRSPYGVAKTAAHYAMVNYRESFGLRTYCGILFNHESEYRGIEFVTRKITDGVARIALGLSNKIELQNVTSMRDWGYAPDYVEAMWRILQQDKEFIFVIATEEVNSIKDFLHIAFNEIGIGDWTPYVVINEDNARPAEVPYLLGNTYKARSVLGWSPKVRFEEMVRRMVKKDIERLSIDAWWGKL